MFILIKKENLLKMYIEFVCDLHEWNIGVPDLVLCQIGHGNSKKMFWHELPAI